MLESVSDNLSQTNRMELKKVYDWPRCFTKSQPWQFAAGHRPGEYWILIELLAKIDFKWYPKNLLTMWFKSRSIMSKVTCKRGKYRIVFHTISPFNFQTNAWIRAITVISYIFFFMSLVPRHLCLKNSSCVTVLTETGATQPSCLNGNIFNCQY